MAKQIIYGIGKALLRDFRNPSKIIGYADLQDLSVESSVSMDDITGGNKMFPIASFKKESGLKVSTTSAVFNPEMIEYLDGATGETGVAVMTEVMDIAVPEDGVVTLEGTPVESSVFVAGMTVASGESPEKGKYTVSGSTVTFSTEDAGKSVIIVYDYNSSENAVTYAITETSMTKPFIFDYMFPIYDEDTQQTHKAQLKIFKAQCSSGFKLNAQHRAPFAPQFEASAKDPKRVDKKMWTLMIDGVEV